MKNSQHVQKSAFTALILLIVYGFVHWIITTFISVVNDLASLVQYVLHYERNPSLVISIMCVAATIWLLGYIQIRKIIVYFFKKRAQKTKENFFCARIVNPHFMGGYHIGIVTNQCLIEDKRYYTLVFNIAGLMTVPNVPENDIERVDMSMAQWAMLYLSFGVM